MAPRPALTARQREIFTLISERIRACGYAPTLREIGAHLGIRSTNGVADHIKALKRKGYLAHTQHKSRTLSPLPRSATTPPRPASTGVRLGVPLLGEVAGGAPIFAPPATAGSAQQMIEVDPSLLGSPTDRLYALRVRGASMRDAGIFDGDIVFVRQAEVAAARQIVVALLDDEATVKTFVPQRRGVVLRAANPSYEDIVLSAAQAQSLRIMGVVVGVFRRL